MAKWPRFNNLTIRHRLLALAAITSSLFVLQGAIAWWNVHQAHHTLVQVFDDHIVPIRQLKQVSDHYTADVSDTINRALGGIITPQEAISRVDEALDDVEKTLGEYKSKHAYRGSDELAYVQRLEDAILQADQAAKQAKLKLSEGKLEELRSIATTEFFFRFERVSLIASQVIDYQLSRVRSIYEGTRDTFIHNRRVNILIICFGIMMIFLLTVGLAESIRKSFGLVAKQLDEIGSREADLTKRVAVQRADEVGEVSYRFNVFMDKLQTLVRGVQRSGKELTSSVKAITSTSRQLEQTARDFGAFTNQVGSTAKEISATSYELVNTMQDVSQVATNTASLATEGQQGLVAMEKTMSQMEEAAKSISGKLAVISDKAANITTVVTTITKIADQTNLLSLNASIEAEKAGEYGLGFAVVAREIRRLADQVALATLDIDQMVREMKSAVSAGVMEMDRFSEEVRKDVEDVRSATQQLNQIIEQVQALLPRFEMVLEGVQAQSEGAQQISDSMVQLTDSVEQTNLSIKESNQIADRLGVAAQGLQKEVSGFEIGPDTSEPANT
ncbi:MAG: methyl-accepting chemotaxis protein [Chlamydiia bacterium]|nr:methyl-accepting chemotaxis protein [Chlamydiia bacterium]